MATAVATRKVAKKKIAIPKTLVMPRLSLVPPAVDWSLGDRAVEWALEHGIMLDAEQQYMLRSMLGLDADGRWWRRIKF